MSKKPFFANFLESQLSEQETTSVQGGTVTTKPYDLVQTMKYPSDSEEGPGGSTKPAMDEVQTMKYPSDNDESGTEI
jgi:hypothetical protein